MRKTNGIFEVRRKELAKEHDRLKELIQLGNQVFVMPDFLREFGHNDTLNPLLHEFEGSFHRHLIIERFLLKIRDWLESNDAMPGYTIAQAVLSIFFGFNCSFSSKDIALYIVWYLRRCKPLAVLKKPKSVPCGTITSCPTCGATETSNGADEKVNAVKQLVDETIEKVKEPITHVKN